MSDERFKKGDLTIHPRYGLCVVTDYRKHVEPNLLTYWRADLRNVVEPTCSTTGVAAEECEKPDRLELQAYGLLDEVEVGDWVYCPATPGAVWFVAHIFDDGLAQLEDTEGAPRISVPLVGLRLATPAELHAAGIIDEIPQVTMCECGEPRAICRGCRHEAAMGEPRDIESLPRDPKKAAKAIADGAMQEFRDAFFKELEGEDDPRPRDANGEVLEVGDLVKANRRFYRFKRLRGDDEIEIFEDIKDGWEGHLPPPTTHKLHTLTTDQYLPLARRTIPEGMTRKERLGMLTRGVCGEYSEITADESVEEIGDLLWYSTLLAEEVGRDPSDSDLIANEGLPITWLKLDGNRRDEYVKKAIYHDAAKGCLVRLAAEGLHFCYRAAARADIDIGEIRLANIRKLLNRYPDGFEEGGGVRDSEETYERERRKLSEDEQMIDEVFGDFYRSAAAPAPEHVDANGIPLCVGDVIHYGIEKYTITGFLDEDRDCTVEYGGGLENGGGVLNPNAVEKKPPFTDPQIDLLTLPLTLHAQAPQHDPDLARLVELGLVKIVHSDRPRPKWGTRVYFRLTEAGRRVAGALEGTDG